MELFEDNYNGGENVEEDFRSGKAIHKLLIGDNFLGEVVLPLFDNEEQDLTQDFDECLNKYKMFKLCSLLNKSNSQDPILKSYLIRITLLVGKYAKNLNMRSTVLQKCFESINNVKDLVENASELFDNPDLTDKDKVKFIANLLYLLTAHLKEHPDILQKILTLNKSIDDSEIAFPQYFCDDALLTPMIDVIQRYSEDMSLGNCPAHKHKCDYENNLANCQVCKRKQPKRKNDREVNGEEIDDNKESIEMIPSKSSGYHNMVIMFLRITYSFKSISPHKYEKTLHAVLRCHDYNVDCIKDCIESDNTIKDATKPILAKEFDQLLPKHETTASVASWMNQGGFSTVGSLWVLVTNLQDYALDWRICGDYFAFNSFCRKNQYQCDIIDMVTETAPTNDDQKQSLNDTCKEVLTVTRLAPLLPFIYALFVMLLTHIMQFCIVIKKRNDTYKSMIYYLVGACCQNKI